MLVSSLMNKMEILSHRLSPKSPNQSLNPIIGSFYQFLAAISQDSPWCIFSLSVSRNKPNLFIYECVSTGFLAGGH